MLAHWASTGADGWSTYAHDAGTAPDEKQKTVKVGGCILVLGIPRVDLALVSWRIRHGGDALRWSLPYEIIIVGVYDDEPKECGDE
jgi:hypothetical protein